MLRHNLLLTYRNFIRFKSTFIINLVGLSTGLACAILIYLWVKDEINMDKFHEQDNRIYQVMTRFQSADGIGIRSETAPILAEILAEEMPEVELAVAEGLIPEKYTLSVDENRFKTSGAYASKDYFNLFSYNLLRGQKNQVLADDSNIVISQDLAMKLFSTTADIVGRAVEIDGKGQFLISGIFNVPANSSRQFDFLIPLQAAFKHFPNLQYNWSSSWVNTHILLKEGADRFQFNSKIADLVNKKAGQEPIELFTRKYSEAYLYGHYENGIQTGGRIEYVRLFSIIAVFILLIACINFMNLSTANASRRLKEVGIKKAIGAARKTLVIQYLGESLLMAFLALILAILMVSFILPQFNTLTGKHLLLVFDSNLILALLGIILFTGLIAGSYPALYLSGFNPVGVLQGKLATSSGELSIRKGLIVFQFIMSVILIVAVSIVYKQIELIQHKPLGYNKDNIIFFQMEGRVKDHLETFLSEVEHIPGITGASSMFMSFFGNINSTSDLSWQGKDPDYHVDMQYRRVNYGLTELLEINLATGRSFSEDHRDSARIVLNEAAIAAMGLEDPIGKIVKLWNKEVEIIGVAKDFHFQSLHERVKPLFLYLNPQRTNNIVLKIEADKAHKVIRQLQDLYKIFNPGYPLDYQFLDQEYQAQYVAEKRVSVLSKYFAGLAILISCLGLFGLAAFTAERRTKEIGIRKTLGASEVGIVRLISGDFVILIGIAIIIALPISFFLTQNWLDNFAYQIDLKGWFFVEAGLLTMIIALLTVSIESIKAAMMNPVKSLRSE